MIKYDERRSAARSWVKQVDEKGDATVLWIIYVKYETKTLMKISYGAK